LVLKKSLIAVVTERVEAIAGENRCTTGQLVLASLLAQGSDVVPIPGTKRKDLLLQDIGTLSVALTDDDVARISATIPVGTVAGLRYPEALMGSVYL
jgi:aryl-alcohol dehydrogenase-like predicted oxidoreductase